MTPHDEKLDRALHTLASLGPRQAPPAVEAALRSAFRRRNSRPPLARWALALAAVLLMVILAPRPQPAHPSTQIATRFYPLQDAATLPPFEYGTLVRVRLPRSALRLVGLPVNEDRLSERIDADVLLGQDGLARAVRFVQ